MISGTRFRTNVEIQRQSALAAELERLNTQITTEKSFQKSSDDPQAAARVANIRRSQAEQAAWASNVSTATSLSQTADGTLASLKIAVDRANELLIRGRTVTTSANDREAIATELRGLADQVVELTSRRDQRGEFVFATGVPIEIPIGDGVRIAPTLSFDDVVQVPSHASLDRILRDASDALLLTDDAARATATGVSLAAVGASIQHVIGTQASQGLLGGRIEIAQEQLADTAIELQIERTDVEAIDKISVYAQFTALQLTLSAAQSAFVRTHSSTLFDRLV